MSQKKCIEVESIVNTPWYYKNDYLHRYLNILTGEEDIKGFVVKHEERRCPTNPRKYRPKQKTQED